MPAKLTPENMPESTQPNGPVREPIKENVTKVVQWFFPVVGLTYACGFLIVFTFFKSFGINTVEFIEAKYIHIGSLFVMACIIIILPMHWLFIGISRWFDEGKNKARVKNIIKGLFRSGKIWKTIRKVAKQPKLLLNPHAYCRFCVRQPVCRIFIRFFWSDWQTSVKHGIHATFPVIGSAILMMWCFLLLLTFASPNFSQTHSKLFFFNLLFPLAIIALAIPADWIGNKSLFKKKASSTFSVCDLVDLPSLASKLENEENEDFLYSTPKNILRWGRSLIRVWLVVAGLICLFLFFWKRPWFFDYDPLHPNGHLHLLVILFFGPPVITIIYLLSKLFFWHETENDRIKTLRQRLTIARWVLYPIQWILFLGQFWFFLRVIIHENLDVSLREVFVGKDWHLFASSREIWNAGWCWVFLDENLKEEQIHKLFPVGGFIFIFFVVLLVFFAFRNFYRIKKMQDYSLRTMVSAFCLLGVLFYFSILSFARHIYPYIPAVKGGGDYTLSHPVQLTFDTRFTNSIPPAVTKGLQTNCLSLILLDANSSFVFLADTNDAGGPEEWRSNPNKPTVYEIRREAIISITHLNPAATNSANSASTARSGP
jgi:hypothetical protein